MIDSLFAVHLSATAIMTGVIWIVQLILYPWLNRWPPESFAAYHLQYTTRVGYVVGPAIIIETVTGMLVYMGSDGMVKTIMGWSLLLVLVNIISTALLQVPCHQRLSRGYDAAMHQKLVSTNWIRTAAWSLRLLLVVTAISMT